MSIKTLTHSLHITFKPGSLFITASISTCPATPAGKRFHRNPVSPNSNFPFERLLTPHLHTSVHESRRASGALSALRIGGVTPRPPPKGSRVQSPTGRGRRSHLRADCRADGWLGDNDRNSTILQTASGHRHILRL